MTSPCVQWRPKREKPSPWNTCAIDSRLCCSGYHNGRLSLQVYGWPRSRALARGPIGSDIEAMAPKPAIDFSKLSFTERLQLVEDLWDSLEAEQDAIPIPEWHLEELDRRLKAYRESPEAGAGWEEVRDRILKRGA